MNAECEPGPCNEAGQVSPEAGGAATRFREGKRYDLLEADFLAAMAMIMDVGASKYGEHNWKKGLKGEKGGVNHALSHIIQYQQGAPNDYGPKEIHMAQVAINAMFEFHFCRQERMMKEADEVIEANKKAVEAIDNLNKAQARARRNKR
jgi:hypothetical protein